jgi:hypothetical protein
MRVHAGSRGATQVHVGPRGLMNGTPTSLGMVKRNGIRPHFHVQPLVHTKPFTLPG